MVARTDPERGDFQSPASEAVPLTVYAPDPGGLVAGVGRVPDTPASTGTFVLAARTRADGTPTGLATYAFRDAGGADVVIRSTTWRGGGLALTGDRATLASRCVVTVLDRRGHVVSTIEDARMRIDAVDGGGLRGPDAYAVSVFTPTGRLYHRIGTRDQPLLLGSGQIVVQR